MRFTDEFIRRVMEANNIVDIISQYTQLKSAGGGLMGRCPFPDHQEKSPSFSVSETKQVYHCFGCHKSGNLITFLRDYSGYSFPEAVEWLANRVSIPLPQKDSRGLEEDRQAQRRRQLMDVNLIAMKFFRAKLEESREDSVVRQYLAKRGLTVETVEAFQIGFAPREWDALINHLAGKNILISLAEEARLAVARKEGKSGHFDMFRDRLMFPIQNTMGDVVAFGGRVLNPEDAPKYLNSPETPVFEKKKILYGLHQTARYIRSDDLALIVEGYMDAVSLYQAGLKNVAAVMSSSLTPEQARLLQRMTKNVVMLLDGDQAGMDGAERSLPILLQAGCYPKGVFLPDNMDPDDFVRANGADALRKLVDRAQDLLFVILDRWMAGYRGEPAEKLKLADKLRPVLNVVADPRLKDLYLQEVGRRIGVSLQWMRQSLEASTSQGDRRGMPDTVRAAANPNPPVETSLSVGEAADEAARVKKVIVIKGAPAAEMSSMALALKSRANFEIYAQESSLESFRHAGIRELLSEATRVYGQDPTRFDRLTSLLVTMVDEPGLLFPKDPFGAKASAERAEEDVAELDAKMLRDSLKRVREIYLRTELQELRRDLVTDPTPEKKERMAELQKHISSFTKS